MAEAVSKIEVGTFLKNAYSQFGKHINTERAAPQLMDGCKPVIRRILYASYTLGKDFVKCATISGETMGKYHPHGNMVFYPVIVSLVKSGIMEGQGQFGKEGMEPETSTRPAAERYTEAKLKDSFYEFFDMLMKYVPFVDSEIDKYQLPEYLPTPIPLALIMSAFGIGFGMNTDIPNFTIKSLMDAYLHDDYKRLRLNCDWIVDYKLSEFKQLWEEGNGNIYASFRVEQGYSLDGTTYGTIISGTPTKTYKPGKLIPEEVQELINQGKIIKRDESSKGNGNRLFLARAKRVSVINDDWIYDRIRRSMIKSFNYRLNVAHDGKVGMIGIRDWIHVTYTNYIKILKEYLKSNIKSIEWKLTLLEYADKVMDEFQKSGMKHGPDEIARILKIDRDIVSDIMKQSLNSWRRLDKDAKKKKLEAELIEWKAKVPEDIVLDLVNKL